MTAGAAYDAAVKAQGKGHKLGSPHLHIAPAVIEVISKDESLPSSTRQTLTTLTAFFDHLSQEQMDQLIPFFRVKKSKGKPPAAAAAAAADGSKTPAVQYQFQWCVHPAPLFPWNIPGIESLLGDRAKAVIDSAFDTTPMDVRLALREGLVHSAKLTMSVGTPPRGQFERVVQQQLGQLVERTKNK